MATEYSLLTWMGRTPATVTFTDAGDIVNHTAHGARTGLSVQFPDNAGNTLPTGLSKNTTYYIREGADANKYTLHTSKAMALANTGQVTFTGTGSGTHKVIGAYWATLDTAGRERYGSAGSERVYNGLSAWGTYITSAKTADMAAVLEIEGRWKDTSGDVHTPATTGTYSVTFTTKINGVRGSGYHGGVIGGGYQRIVTSDRAGFPSTARTIIDGLDIVAPQATYGSAINPAAGTTIKNCLVTGYKGIYFTSTNFTCSNCLAYSCTQAGFYFENTVGYASIIYNCLAVKSGTGFHCPGAATLNMGVVNCVSVGNTTNWAAAPTGGTWFGLNNAGSTGNSPWGAAAITTATADNTTFVDYTNNDFRHAGDQFAHTTTSVLVDAANTFVGLDAVSISNAMVANGDPRPAYKNGDATAYDIGPFEFDWGYGLSPISVTFTDLQAGSTVRVFTTGTQTELASTTNSDTTFAAIGATGTVDYTICKDGFIIIRMTGVVLFDGITISGKQTVDRAWVQSSGLTYGTTAIINTSTKIFTIGTATTGQNWYSFWVEQFRTHADLRNKEFPLQANGPNSFSLRQGYEFDGATSLAYLSRDGIRYVNTSGVQTAVYAALLSVGVPSGARVRYQQTDGGTTINATATSGNIDELVQVYGDATHGNFDRRGYLVCKVQEMGYDQVEADVVSLYGTLEDQLYVIGLAPLPNGIATGNPSLANPPTITDHAGSPVTWNSKAFSITITDSAAGNSGTDIMKWLRYYFETGGTFHGKDTFCWHDLVQQNGSDFKTVRGSIYGDTGAAIKGVRVIKNGTTDPHGDFNLFTSDDGTTYAPPVVAAAEATILTGSRVQLYNVTTDTEINNVFSAGTGYSYTITTEASVGDTLRLNVCKKGRLSTPAYAVWGASGVTFLVDQPEHTIYTGWGIDGETVTEFALDTTGTVEIDANDVDGSTQKTRLAAWYNYILTTADGIRYLYNAITVLAANSIRINVDVLDLQIENINAATALKFTDLDVRLFRSDGTSIIAATSYSIHNDYTGVPDVSVVTVSGSNVITGDISDVSAQVQAGLTSQGYSTARATKLDNLDAAISSAGGGLTSAQDRLLKLSASACAGKISGSDSTTIVIRDVDDTVNAIVATVDDSGNRTAITYGI